MYMHAHKTLSNEMLLLRKIAELEIGTCTLWFTKFLYPMLKFSMPNQYMLNICTKYNA